MGFFDDMIASSYREENGEYYFVAGRKTRRFLSQSDYERSRARFANIMMVAMGLIPVLGITARHFGFGWMAGGLALVAVWMLTFGQAMVTANSIPAPEGSTAATPPADQPPLPDDGSASKPELDAPKPLPQAIPILPAQRSATPWWIAGVAGVLVVGLAFWWQNKESTASDSPIDIVAQAGGNAMQAGGGDSEAEPTTINASGFSGDEQALIKQAEAAYSDARNSVSGAYERHTTLLSALFSQGICWGRVDQSEADYDYHRCDGGSIQTQAHEEPVSASAPSQGQGQVGEAGRCLLRVSGTAYIDGDCRINLQPDGSFEVAALDSSYFASVLRDGAGAQGYWNESPGATHAHADLGPLARNGACWENQAAQICAWR